MTDLVAADHHQSVPQRAISILDMEPDQMAAKASKIATVLKDIIDKQGLFTTIQGKQHIKVDGWCALGNFLGVLPREDKVTELEDGSYEAKVDLIRWADGTRVGGASAICSVTEPRWARADKNARRSMAITRATGKAFRISFSWIVCLAGYSPTPLEEMPEHAIEEAKPKQAKAPAKAATVYTGENKQAAIVQEILTRKNVPVDLWDTVHSKLMNRPSTDLDKIIAEVVQ